MIATTRILLAEDHNTVREGIKMLVNAQPDMEVIGEAADGMAAIEQTRALDPDLLVMDISMPELNGLKATERLRREFPNLKILTLTRHTDDGYLQQLIKAGVNGYVLKQSAPDGIDQRDPDGEFRQVLCRFRTHAQSPRRICRALDRTNAR